MLSLNWCTCLGRFPFLLIRHVCVIRTLRLICFPQLLFYYSTWYLRRDIKAVALALGMVKWMAIETKKFQIMKWLYLNGGGGQLLYNLSKCMRLVFIKQNIIVSLIWILVDYSRSGRVQTDYCWITDKWNNGRLLVKSTAADNGQRVFSWEESPLILNVQIDPRNVDRPLSCTVGFS